MNIVDICDYYGNRVIFTHKRWKEKSKQHPELVTSMFIQRIKNTLKNPDQIWEDFELNGARNKNCYYKKYGRFVKVVVWYRSSPQQIVTAFSIDAIKEIKYGLKRIL